MLSEDVDVFIIESELNISIRKCFAYVIQIYLRFNFFIYIIPDFLKQLQTLPYSYSTSVSNRKVVDVFLKAIYFIQI